ARRRRGADRRLRSGDAALGPRRAGGPLPDAVRDHPRPGHAPPPADAALLRLRGGPLPRAAGRTAARRGRLGGGAVVDRGGRGRRKDLLEETRRQSGNEPAPNSVWMVLAGWVVSAPPVLLLLMSGVMKLVKPPLVTEGFGHLGYPESLALGLGLLELVCTAVYL